MATSSLESGEIILVTNLYVLIDIYGKNLHWSYIRYVQLFAPYLPWIIASDFNFMLSLVENGGVGRLGPCTDLSHGNMNLLELIDVKLSNGSTFGLIDSVDLTTR